MRNIFRHIALFTAVFALLPSCEGFIPNSKVDTNVVEEIANINYTNLYQQGIHCYQFLPAGFGRLDGAMLASGCDEADHAVAGCNIEFYQLGTWSATTQPDNNMTNAYRAIRRSHIFLQNSEGYEQKIYRDTTTAQQKNSYAEQCLDIKRLRAENHVMIALQYLELLKRFGGVAIVKDNFTLESDPSLIRATYDEVVSEIVSEIDGAVEDLCDSWQAYKPADFGRFEKGSALAIKARALLYAASPAYNMTGDSKKWKNAADAAKAVIDLGKYRLATDYRNMFLGLQGHQNPEAVLCYMTGENNLPETSNYPVTTNLGNTCTCPSANLVDEYEFADGTPFGWNKVAPGEDPFANRDPRLLQSIVVNGSNWNGRTMEIYEGGKDGIGVARATTTGFYLKKFLTDGLDLEKGQTAIHSWPIIRYAEILLNFAEAMNEAYGPDVDIYGDGKTARWAVNQVRERAGMPDVAATNQADMRKKIRHERQIELAFEEHRFWDVRRWGADVAKSALAAPLMGVKAVKSGAGFTYTEFKVEDREFENHMIYFPIPQSEVLSSNGNIAQNPGW